jgi:hypothetical protein
MLAGDPVIARKSGRCFREGADQLGPRALDVFAFLGNNIFLEVWMPLTETADDEAAIGGSRVEGRKHVPTAALELGLQCLGSARQRDGIRYELGVLWRRGLELRLRARLASKRNDAEEGEPDSMGERAGKLAKRFVAHDK